jgi:hypothetical protein
MMAGDDQAEKHHDPEGCYWCVAQQPPVLSSCRCGDCCRRLLIEATTEDARREPMIQERCSPIFEDPRLTASGTRELIGFLLNAPENDHACAFLDQATNLCTIWEYQP